jgi:vacuolar-type H+-ATPase subunit I/STV1
MRGVGRAFKEGQDVDRVEEDLETLQAERQELERELETELQAAAERLNVDEEALETVAVKPRRADIEVRLVALAWVPYRAGGEPAW